jgi:hypothetical protein
MTAAVPPAPVAPPRRGPSHRKASDPCASPRHCGILVDHLFASPLCRLDCRSTSARRHIRKPGIALTASALRQKQYRARRWPVPGRTTLGRVATFGGVYGDAVKRLVPAAVDLGSAQEDVRASRWPSDREACRQFHPEPNANGRLHGGVDTRAGTSPRPFGGLCRWRFEVGPGQ